MQCESTSVSLVGELNHSDKPLSTEPFTEGDVEQKEVGDSNASETHPSLRKPTRVETEQSDSLAVKEKPWVDIEDEQHGRVKETQEKHASPCSLQPYALDKAPPPIKTRRDTGVREASPPDLSPPPSPKRMRELVLKEDNISLAFGNILPSKLSELKSHLSS